MLARLTDSEIRQLLRAELFRRAEEQAVDAAGPGVLDLVDTRLTEMVNKIETRTTHCAKAFTKIENRYKIVGKRMREGDYGITGTILTGFAVIAVGFGAAFLTTRATKGWRTWLMTSIRKEYWD